MEQTSIETLGTACGGRLETTLSAPLEALIKALVCPPVLVVQSPCSGTGSPILLGVCARQDPSGYPYTTYVPFVSLPRIRCSKLYSFSLLWLPASSFVMTRLQYWRPSRNLRGHRPSMAVQPSSFLPSLVDNTCSHILIEVSVSVCRKSWTPFPFGIHLYSTLDVYRNNMDGK